MSWRVGLLGVLFLCLQMRLWQGPASMPDHWRLTKAIALQLRQVAELSLRNQQLGAEVSELKRSPAALEERARSELGFIKQTETFCQVVEASTD